MAKQIKAAAKPAAEKAVRRPAANLPPSAELIRDITDNIIEQLKRLDGYAAHISALDRLRHNKVGIRRLGFIEAALRISFDFPQYFPHWLNSEKFQKDFNLFNALRSLIEACRSLEEKTLNMNVGAAEMVYTNALEYYAQVQDAARRRVDSAETLYAELHSFFRRGPRNTGEPTEKQLKSDFNALLHKRRDGKIVIENVSPKVIRGKRKVVDEIFNDTVSFKDTDEGSLNE